MESQFGDMIVSKRIVALTLAGLLSSCPLFAIAAEKGVQGSAAPPSAIPGLNQGGSESKVDKREKNDQQPSKSSSGTNQEPSEKNGASRDGENGEEVKQQTRTQDD